MKNNYLIVKSKPFIIKELIIGREDKMEEIKTFMEAGNTNEQALIHVGIIDNDDLEVFMYCVDDSGNYFFEDIKVYNEREASKQN